MWACPSLDRLIYGGLEVAAVVTNPDRPSGRGLKLQPSPVKEAALEAGIEVLQPEKARDPALHERMKELQPDVAVVVAYGKILPLSLLEIPSRGFVNVHFSLLPLYRGAAPVQRAIMDGRTETGVSIMVLTEGMDEGPVLARQFTPIRPEDTAGSVGQRLALSGADILVDALERYVSGELEPEPQNDEEATYAPKITPEEARIDWTEQAEVIANHVRGLNPAPGAWTTLQGLRLKVWKVTASPETGLGPGALEATRDALVVGTGSTAVELVDVQMHGKRRMGGADLARGLRLGAAARCE